MEEAEDVEDLAGEPMSLIMSEEKPMALCEEEVALAYQRCYSLQLLEA